MNGLSRLLRHCIGRMRRRPTQGGTAEARSSSSTEIVALFEQGRRLAEQASKRGENLLALHILLFLLEKKLDWHKAMLSASPTTPGACPTSKAENTASTMETSTPSPGSPKDTLH